MKGLEAIQRVQAVASEAEEFVLSVSASITADLTRMVDKAERRIDADEPIDEYWLQRLALQLPIKIYKVSSGATQATVRAEVAKLAAAHVYDEHILSAREKTASDRKAGAELASENEELAASLTKAILLDVKMKLDSAQALYEGVKKIMSARDAEKPAFRGVK